MTSHLVVLLVQLLCGARARWLGTDPDTRQRIYFANHTSHLDVVVLWAALPPPVRALVRPVAARDYWTQSRLHLHLATHVFNALLIERRKVTIHENPLKDMLEALGQHHSLIVFPEGGRFPGPEPKPFKSGLYHLAKRRPDIELVPVLLENLNRILPKGEVLPVPLLGSITIGYPIRLLEDEAKSEFLERARRAVWDLRLA